jgi:suppressor of fused
MTDEATDSSPGWEAIDASLRPLYGDREPKHFGTIIKWMMGGPDPLDGTSAYKRTDGTCHWHFISYGLTELYSKESEDPAVSGYGFELTFRLACSPDEEMPPSWAMSLMQNLARYVFKTGNTFAAGHHMTLNGPIALGTSTELSAVLFVADPELPATNTPHGQISFLQIVGLTADEWEAVQLWSGTGFAAVLAKRFPLLVTDLARESILKDPESARTVAERTALEGSSMGELFVSTGKWTQKGLFSRSTRITMDAMSTDSFIKQLRGRLLHKQPLIVIGKGGKAENVVAFRPAEEASVGVDKDGFLVVTLPTAAAAELSQALRPERGLYRCASLKDFEIEVVPTEIKDQAGKVIRVVG